MLRRLRSLTRRQRALLAAGVGAAGAALYYAASSALEAWQEEERTLALRALAQQREREVAEREAEQQLHDHFDSIQRISDTTTLPTLLPHLRSRLCALADVEALTGRLQACARGEAPLCAQDKLACWEELKVQSFARTLSSAWSVVLLDLFLRVQLNLLGSHVYLSAALGQQQEGGDGQTGASSTHQPRRRALSLAAQHAYLALHGHFICDGTRALVPQVTSACRRVLADVPLSAALTHVELCALTALIQRDLAGEAAAAGPQAAPLPSAWAALLMPPPFGDAQLLREAGVGDGELLASLVAETRAVLAGGRFAAVLAGAMDQARLVVDDAMRVAFGDPTLLTDTSALPTDDPASSREAGQDSPRALPLAKLVPVMAAATERALMAPKDTAQQGGRPGVAAALGKMGTVDAFCADLFSAVA